MSGRVLVTGSAGFVGRYVVTELLARGYQVTGLDDFSKYGPAPWHERPGFFPVCGDARDPHLVRTLLDGCDHFIAGAAMAGGIGYFHARPYDLLAANERITAAAFDAALAAHRDDRLRKITVVSSSMVYESATHWPTAEGQELASLPPRTSYGFQKLATEFFARAARDQYGLPYTIVRPFNCVGVGEAPGRDAHVLPDLVARVMAGRDPLRILGDGSQVRHYTYGGDLAKGICDTLDHPKAWCEDFNLSTAQGTTVTELAALIWGRFHPGEPLRAVMDKPYPHDVQTRVPDVSKAKRLLGFEAVTPLAVAVDEVIEWMRGQYGERS